MKVTKRLIAFFMAAMMIFSVLPVMNVSAKTVESGKCGENLNWALDDKGTLTISGTGKMYDYDFYSAAPWAELYENVKAVNISSGVTSICDDAFKDCSSLKSITIPDSVTSIGDDAFYGTAYYNNSSNWKNGVLYIGNHLIEAKESIKGSYKIKSGTKCIADWAFYDCTGLKSITIPDSVTSIGDYAFRDCTCLTSITIPDSVTSIGDYAFKGCTELTSITIPNSVTSIGDSAFSGCSSLTSIKIGSGVKSIGYEAFYGCTGLKSITIPDSVTSIGGEAFYGCSSLKSITIPDSVTSIGSFAFCGCNSLKSIKIPDGVTSIGGWAFSGCSSLKSITIPDSVTSIGIYAFSGTAYYNNSSNWKNGVLYIGNHLIEAKTSIKGSYKIKSGTKCIADYAFNYCDELTSVTIPDSVTSIGNYAFYCCTGLKSITISDGVTSIGGEAFYGCSSLKSVTIPDSVTNIGGWAFIGCTGLKSITIPNSVTSIGYNAFYNTAYYNNSSNWKNDVLYIGNYLIDAKTSIKGSYKIKSGTKCIAELAFYLCKGLTSVTIPNSVTSIGEYAFCGCNSLTSVTIPGSVKFIGNEAFGYNIGMDDTFKKNSDFIIYGHKGSAANTYAKENGFKFVAHKNNYTSKVTAKATTSKSGKITYTCDCGYSYTKSISKIKSVTLSSDTYTYNGKAKKPTVTVTDSKGNTLKNGTDYTVSYSSGRTNVGKYTVTVTFKGKYSGTKKLTFKIKPKSTSISKLTAGKKQFTATWYKRTEQTSGYQLEYSTSSSLKNASRKTYTTTSKNSRTITGLKSAKKYYVRIRTYKNVKIGGKTYKYYSAWSSVKSVKTK